MWGGRMTLATRLPPSRAPLAASAILFQGRSNAMRRAQSCNGWVGALHPMPRARADRPSVHDAPAKDLGPHCGAALRGDGGLHHDLRRTHGGVRQG
jgi:hypothetical protein